MSFSWCQKKTQRQNKTLKDISVKCVYYFISLCSYIATASQNCSFFIFIAHCCECHCERSPICPKKKCMDCISWRWTVYLYGVCDQSSLIMSISNHVTGMLSRQVTHFVYSNVALLFFSLATDVEASYRLKGSSVIHENNNGWMRAWGSTCLWHQWSKALYLI